MRGLLRELRYGSGEPRAGDLPSHLWNTGVHTVAIDIKTGGYAHDLANSASERVV